LSLIDDGKDTFSTCRVDDKSLLLHYIEFKYVPQCLLINLYVYEINQNMGQGATPRIWLKRRILCHQLCFKDVLCQHATPKAYELPSPKREKSQLIKLDMQVP